MVDWCDPADPVVAACLTVTCGVCKAPPGIPCRSITGTPLNRVVHHYRQNKLMKCEK
ncbi:zinc finger domain-containing protein [Mycolicibacterium canariasense]|uniref:zinc finger domain-containing protein n=1 Tax=Mycolicibacterium canariasense TaxID=228230 RepID=UPI003D7C3644